jgi:hypothetical protein
VSRVTIAANVPNFFDPHSGHAAGFKAASSGNDPEDSRRRSNLKIGTPQRE